VNNGQPQVSRVEEFQKVPNKLLEQTDGNRLDVGSSKPTSRVDSDMEAVGAIDWTKDEAG
jgi:hypothetical protein